MVTENIPIAAGLKGRAKQRAIYWHRYFELQKAFDKVLSGKAGAEYIAVRGKKLVEVRR